MSHFNKFLADAKASGLSMSEALAHPGAQAAAQRDDEAARTSNSHASKNEFLAAFAQSRRAAGGPAGFADQEEMLLAMQDPAYETNPEYRAAVETIVARTPAETIGVNINAKFSDGYKVNTGAYDPNKATVNSMLDNARRDALREHVESIDQSTAKGRYEFMKFIAENPDAANAIYEDITTPANRTHEAMLSDKAEGKPDQVVIMPAETERGY